MLYSRLWELTLKIELLLNLSKQIQKYRGKQVQNLAEGDWGDGWLHQSLTATMFLWNIFIRMMSCSHIMSNLFTRMTS